MNTLESIILKICFKKGISIERPNNRPISLKI